MRIRLNKKGFTLIELLIVVAIIGIIAAIAIPNLLNAIQRGKQKRTMADMRAIATSVEAFAVDNNRYPGGASAITAITNVVSPKYIKVCPTVDAWTHAYDYVATPTGNAQTYSITSYGKDGVADTVQPGPTTDFNNDIVFSTGSFLVYPEGAQQ